MTFRNKAQAAAVLSGMAEGKWTNEEIKRACGTPSDVRRGWGRKGYVNRPGARRGGKGEAPRSVT